MVEYRADFRPPQFERRPSMSALSNRAMNQAEWPGFCSLADPYSLMSRPFTPMIRGSTGPDHRVLQRH